MRSMTYLPIDDGFVKANLDDWFNE
jgi:hypothetical protein